jgi:hypothetical protein
MAISISNLTADDIALMACAVSAISAWFAWSAAGQARRANALVLLEKQQEIYDGFFELSMHMSLNARSAEKAEVAKFYYLKNRAKTSLPYSLSKKIEQYYEVCFKISDIRGTDAGFYNDAATPFVESERELAPIIDRIFLAILKKNSGFQEPVYRRLWMWLNRLV